MPGRQFLATRTTVVNTHVHIPLPQETPMLSTLQGPRWEGLCSGASIG